MGSTEWLALTTPENMNDMRESWKNALKRCETKCLEVVEETSTHYNCDTRDQGVAALIISQVVFTRHNSVGYCAKALQTTTKDEQDLEEAHVLRNPDRTNLLYLKM